ncbi:MAG: hypothetical protein EOO15_12235 [Chitinophagaceae bacterium]|nr:MAG: hypothetical protein EOO15_12235 [Chitinophagaceae bacterium]
MSVGKSGKKVRSPNPRRSLDAESQVLRTIDKIADAGGLLPGGYFDQRVILELYQTIRSSGTGGEKGLLEDTWLGGDGELFKPRRWYDTTPRFRKYMLLYGIKGDANTHRPLTIWTGKDMIEASRSSDKPLAKTLHKNMTDRLRRLLGTGEFGFWFNIENSNKAPYALHAHGLLYVRDPRYLVRPSDERTALVRELRLASGDDLSTDKKKRIMTANNWVKFAPKQLNTGWIDYCRKARRGRLFRVSAPEPPKDIGVRLEAGTHNLTRQASEFYSRARLLFRGMADGSIERWSKEDWESVSGK